MFSIVSMQDVSINLNGGDDLFKLFDRPRSRNRPVSLKSPKEKTTAFIIQKAWVLPSHILVLMDDKNKQELIAYDQLPKVQNSVERTDLLSCLANSTSGILDLFLTVQSQEYVLIVLKNGDVLVWSFCKPSYRWKHVSILSLCKGKGCQLVQCEFDGNLLVWCEKRTSSQCCICTAKLNFDNATAKVINTRALLHNCLPMNIYMMAHSLVCLVPVLNKPPGLLLFWSAKTDAIKVHMWADDFNEKYLPVSTSDFQSIITSCISLWINIPNTASKFVCMATHPCTKEMVILRNDLKVYLVTSNSETDTKRVVHLCSLEVSTEKEQFSKQVLKLFPFQRMLLLVMNDGIINIFDAKGGLFLWKTETFKSNSPQIWVRKGDFPVVGVWNRSGIWNLQPKPIADQIKELQTIREPEEQNENKKINVEDLSNVDYALDIFDGQQKTQRNKRRRRIKQGINRSTDLPIGQLFQILSSWNLSNVATDLALTAVMRIKELLMADHNEEDIDIDDVFCLLSTIKDPVLLVVLFSDQNLPYTVKKQLLCQIKDIINSPSSRNMDESVLAILKEYLSIEEDIRCCYGDKAMLNVEQKSKDVIENELQCLQNIGNDFAVDKTLVYLCELDQEYMMTTIVKFLLLEVDTDSDSDKLAATMWKSFLRLGSLIYEKCVVYLWQENPTLFFTILKKAESNKLHLTNAIGYMPMATLVSKALDLIHLPVKKNVFETQEKEKVEIYCQLLQLSKIQDSKDKAYSVLLEYYFITEALDMLKEHADNSQKHCSLFFKMFLFLIESKKLAEYVDVLKTFVPTKFNMPEVYNVLCNQPIEMGGGAIFVKSQRDLSIAMFKPFLEVMLS